MTICAVIPAAGRGTRLGARLPKILTPLSGDRTIWSILQVKLSPLVDHIHVTLSPDGAAVFPHQPAAVSISIQPEPLGMGDAVFRGHDVWSRFDSVLVIWGDQVFVSSDTLSRAIAALNPAPRHAVLPVTRLETPYVEYRFEDGRLTRVLQSREGDTCAARGYGDVGTFLLNTQELRSAWEAYLPVSERGVATGEINFLPFLPFLSARGWSILPLEIADGIEARGINTPEDLAFFRSLHGNAP